MLTLHISTYYAWLFQSIQNLKYCHIGSNFIVSRQNTVFPLFFRWSPLLSKCFNNDSPCALTSRASNALSCTPLSIPRSASIPRRWPRIHIRPTNSRGHLYQCFFLTQVHPNTQFDPQILWFCWSGSTNLCPLTFFTWRFCGK